MNEQNQRAEGRSASRSITSPSISLPKGGGAIKGIGETFQPNPFTGTASLSVPIYTSPGRSGFGPELSLSYGSGSGNGIFGLGWSLSIPSITRKTEKGLPQYMDHDESDTFILSGAEDLVPALKKQGGNWVPDELDDISGTYRIKRYRPRTEGLFARIEKWTKKADGDVHWRSITKENIISVYGYTERARIADDTGARVFSWLLEQTFDDKSNLIAYEYKKEDRKYRNNNEEIERDFSLFLYEKNRESATNTYIKTIYYGNAKPIPPEYYRLLDYDKVNDGFYFKVVFDYGEHKKDYQDKDEIPELMPNPEKTWLLREDTFSSYRSGFEIRTRRLCHHILMFHHFPDESLDNALVRSTDFTYEQTPELTRLLSVTQTGYGSGTKRSLPPLEFDYSKAPIDFDNLCIDEPVLEVNPDSLENLPQGLSGPYQLIDLYGEGIAGILTEQAGAWHYKAPLGRIQKGDKKDLLSFAPMFTLSSLPSRSSLQTQQIMDLDGNGYKEVVQFSQPVPGYVEREDDETWSAFHSFNSLPNIDWQDPNLQFIDLNGDGHADILIAKDDYFIWYPSLKKEGFGEARYFQKPKDDEKGPAVVFSDGTQSIHLADISGDGLSDLVRIRNRSVEYWPNSGYGSFGKKISMGEPHFANDREFQQDRIRLFDTDGSGTTDIIYFGSGGTTLYLNQAGNSFRDAIKINRMPVVDNQTSIQVTDLHGNGTGCLTWSSPQSYKIPYIDLMGGKKPHLLENIKNNMGAETRVTYASSTKFYLKDKKEKKPWITKLPFSVYAVERVETYDWISKNRFVTRYAYHHGYFDGREREFRGFGMVEQWDTEEYASLAADGAFPTGSNIDKASHVPPVKTKTWFHTGAYIKGKKISQQFEDEYYREPGLTDTQYEAMLLSDTILLSGLTAQETPWACRALRGSILRQEIFAEDKTDKSKYPYTVSESSYTIKHIQPLKDNRYAVFFVHPRETINYHYERDPSDPRVRHQLTLKVDKYGNVERNIAIGYPRRSVPDRKPEQAEIHITFTVNRFANYADQGDWYRIGLPIETRTYEIVKPPQPTVTSASLEILAFEDIHTLTENLFPLNLFEPAETNTFPYEKWDWRKDEAVIPDSKLRLIEHVRTLYRKDDLSGHLDLGQVQSRALPFETYKLAFTPKLLTSVFGNSRLTDPDQMINSEGSYVHCARDDNWWIPSGKVFYSKDPNHTSNEELTYALDHFFLPHRFKDPFQENTIISYDDYKLLMLESEDPLHNKVIAGEREAQGDIINKNDYRVLQPSLITDPNGNRSAIAFDTLGMVTGTAVMGKVSENKGDLLDNTFKSDLSGQEIEGFFNDPKGLAEPLLGKASTRIIYDLERFKLSGQPIYASTLARETHFHDPLPADGLNIQVSFTYSDGFGRKIQKKIQAEKGPVPKRDGSGKIIVKANGTPEMTDNDVEPRWVGGGWIVFNNKDKPVRQYEPFFSDTYDFDFDARIGVSPILIYDPIERVVATLHPNHTYEKVVFDPWQQKSWDVNDTIKSDPRTDRDILGYVEEYFKSVAPNPGDWKTWLQQLDVNPDNPPTDTPNLDSEKKAAVRTLIHDNTPTLDYFDTLGRAFLTKVQNRCERRDNNGNLMTHDEIYATWLNIDIEGNLREVIDAMNRSVMQYDYDMLSNRIHQASMEAGELWMLNDVTGKPIYVWDSRGNSFGTEYDKLRRPLNKYVKGTGLAEPDRKIYYEKIEYGEGLETEQGQPIDADLNLRTKVYKQYDNAGIITNEEYDFKGNLLQSNRRLLGNYKTTPNWKTDTAIEQETFQSSTMYDALSRPIQQIAPHIVPDGVAVADIKVDVIQPNYNEANLLEKIYVWLKVNRESISILNPDNNPPDLQSVENINYNAKGQREFIEYGNGAKTRCEYDPFTFRLTHLFTIRGAGFPQVCADELTDAERLQRDCPKTKSHCSGVQNLHYTYDPAGNITHIRDDAQQTVYFRNKCVEPTTEYRYDSIYRLIEATGREHLGLNGQNRPLPPHPTSHNDKPRINLPHPGDGNAMGLYREIYVYDEVGNFKEMIHRGMDPAHSGWTRSYAYNETSQLEGDKKNNQLSTTTIGNNNPITEQYLYDIHGNMIRMRHLENHADFNQPNMHWNYKDQLVHIDLGGGGKAYYVYDAAGQRIHKVWEKSGGIIEERIYIGSGFEVFRKKDSRGTVSLERETLHIMDDQKRIVMVDTRTKGRENNIPVQLFRYQHSSHLGSACLELDHNANIISYEEYYPYGSTSYQAGRNETEVKRKQYRYTGKERDEESGFNYYGARCYALWLGRWISCDPGGLIDGINFYLFLDDNPLKYIDLIGKRKHDTSEINDSREKKERKKEQMEESISSLTLDLDEDVDARTYEDRRGRTGFDFKTGEFLTFIVGQTSENNTGALLIEKMYEIGAEGQLYYFKRIAKEKEAEKFEKLPKEHFIKIGGSQRWKREGTTNCSTAILDAIYRLAGGESGAINGISLRDQRFKDFIKEFQGADWVDVFEKYGIGIEVESIDEVRSGDIIGTGTHRFVVLDPIKNRKGKVVKLEIIHATLRTGSKAIKETIKRVKRKEAVEWKIGRFYDVQQ